MGLKSRLGRALALRALRGKVKALRGKEAMTPMGKALKLLDGWKLLIGAVTLIAVKTYDAYHNGHTGDIVGSVLAVMGWLPVGDLTADIGRAVPGLLVVWGVLSKLWKAQMQSRAGASASELLSTEGFVKALVAEEGIPGVVEIVKGPAPEPKQV